MKIVRHTAPDMRQALRAIREQLGEDAVILSSRRVAQGVEVTAAVDFDAARLDSAAEPAESRVTAAPAFTNTAAPAFAAQPGEAVATANASTDEEGSFRARLRVPPDLRSGRYLLEAAGEGARGQAHLEVRA